MTREAENASGRVPFNNQWEEASLAKNVCYVYPVVIGV